MHSKYSFIYFTLLVVLSSCGIGPNEGSTVNRSVISYLAESRCAPREESEKPVALRKIKKFYLNVDQKLQNFFNISVSNSDTGMNFGSSKRDFTFGSPLKISMNDISRLTNELESELKIIIGEEQFHLFQTNENVDRFSFAQVAANETFLSKLRHLHEDAERFESIQCALKEFSSRKRNDMKDHLYLDSLKCDASDFKNSECLDSLLRNFKKSKSKNKVAVEGALLNLCQANENESKCHMEFHYQKKNNQLSEFYRYYSKEFNKKQRESFFGLIDPKKFECKKDGNGVVSILIPFLTNYNNNRFLPFGREFLLQEVERKWSNSRVKIQIQEVLTKTANTVSLTFQDSSSSYVHSDKPFEINVGKLTPNQLLGRTIAHEFGHVLGFPDCYVQFYDRNSDELVYYELDRKRKNLMCSLKRSFKAPDEYLDLLVQKSCQF